MTNELQAVYLSEDRCPGSVMVRSSYSVSWSVIWTEEIRFPPEDSARRSPQGARFISRLVKFWVVIYVTPRLRTCTCTGPAWAVASSLADRRQSQWSCPHATPTTDLSSATLSATGDEGVGSRAASRWQDSTQVFPATGELAQQAGALSEGFAVAGALSWGGNHVGPIHLVLVHGLIRAMTYPAAVDATVTLVFLVMFAFFDGWACRLVFLQVRSCCVSVVCRRRRTTCSWTSGQGRVRVGTCFSCYFGAHRGSSKKLCGSPLRDTSGASTGPDLIRG